MSEPDSSARLLQRAKTAPFLASQEIESQTEKQVAYCDTLASQKREEKQGGLTVPMAGQKKQTLASPKREKQAVKVKAQQGNGHKSQTVKINSLTFRVRLSDRGYRVMLLTVEAGRQREPYLVSLRRSEWLEIESDKTAFFEVVRKKLNRRIAEASGGDKNKIQALLEQICRYDE